MNLGSNVRTMRTLLLLAVFCSPAATPLLAQQAGGLPPNGCGFDHGHQELMRDDRGYR